MSAVHHHCIYKHSVAAPPPPSPVISCPCQTSASLANIGGKTHLCRGGMQGCTVIIHSALRHPRPSCVHSSLQHCRPCDHTHLPAIRNRQAEDIAVIAATMYMIIHQVSSRPAGVRENTANHHPNQLHTLGTAQRTCRHVDAMQ
jgi:hypothetical protein